MFKAIERYGGTGLGEAVPFKNWYADDPKEFINPLIQRCAAGTEHLHAPPETGAYLGEHKTICKGMFEVNPPGRLFKDVLRLDILFPDLHRPVKDHPFDQ